MTARLAAAWERFWFRPAGPTGVIAARAIVSGSALWLTLSRPGLPDVLAWPAAFWAGVGRGLELRFLIVGLPLSVERGLYALLGAALAASLFGLWPRASCLTAAVLLYHFAPLTDILVSGGGPFFHGLTVPVLGLFLLAFARAPRSDSAPSPEWRWPLAAIQVSFAAIYLLSGWSKLVSVGPAWATPGNFEGLVLNMMFPDLVPPWAHVFVGHPVLCGLGALGGVAMDLGIPVALFFPRAARWIVPLAFLGHLAVVPIFGVVFLGLPGLLLFVDWEAIPGLS